MQLIVNKKSDNLFEVGYFDKSKMHYKTLTEEQLINFIDKNDITSLVSNNWQYENRNIKTDHYELNDVELKIYYHLKKKEDKLIYIVFTEEIEIYLYCNSVITMLDSIKIFYSSTLITNRHYRSLKLREKFYNETKIVDSLLEELDLTLKNIYLSSLKNDLISKKLIKVIIKHIKNVVYSHNLVDQIVVATNFNRYIKLSQPPLNMIANLIKLEKINEQSLLRGLHKAWRFSNGKI